MVSTCGGVSFYALKITPTSGIAAPVAWDNGADGANPGVSLYGWNDWRHSDKR